MKWGLDSNSHDPTSEVDEGQRRTSSCQSQRTISLPSHRDRDISNPFQCCKMLSLAIISQSQSATPSPQRDFALTLFGAPFAPILL